MLATGSHWATDGLNALHARADPGRRRRRWRTCSRPSRSCSAGKRPPGRPRRRLRRRGLPRRRGALAELLAREGREVEFVTGYDDGRAVLRRDARGRAHARAPARVRRRACARAPSLTGIEPGRLTCDDAVRRAARVAAAGVVLVTQRVSRRRALPRARRHAARPSSASATASPRGCSPRRSSTATASRARSTAPTPRSRCPTCASASATATSCRRPRSRRRWPSCLPAPATRAARLRVHRGRGRRGRAHRRAAARRPAPDAVVAVGRGAGDAIERCRRAGRALRRAPRRLAPAGRGRPRDPRRARRRLRRHRRARAPTWRSASPARCRTSSAWPAARRSWRSTAIAVRASSSTPTWASRGCRRADRRTARARRARLIVSEGGACRRSGCRSRGSRPRRSRPAPPLSVTPSRSAKKYGP